MNRLFPGIVAALALAILIGGGITLLGGPSDEPITIAEGDNLVDRVGGDMEVALDIAEKCALPVYAGPKIEPDAKISPDAARSLDTRVIQVTVLVHPGDVIDTEELTCRTAAS